MENVTERRRRQSGSTHRCGKTPKMNTVNSKMGPQNCARYQKELNQSQFQVEKETKEES
jgi:hypothetical protein